MRLLHVTHQYRPAIGGAERYITDLSEELARRGHQVDVFTSRSLDYHSWRDELPPAERLEAVDVYRFGSIPRTRLAWRALPYGYYKYWETRARRYEPFIFYGNGPVSPAMFAAILRHGARYDLVHINNLHYAHAWIAFTAARLRRLPVIITPHIHAEHPETHDVGYMRRILRESRAIVADTAGERDYLLERGWNREVVVAGVGLKRQLFPPLEREASRARFGLPADAFVILFLGRKTEYKGLDLCLEAFAALRALRPDVYFLAVGPETDFSRRLWARYAGLPGLVVRDSVPDEERLAALAACDVLALPSTSEAFGIVFLEAWAYCKPVIGAAITAVSSLIAEGEDGFLIEAGRPDLLVRRLACLAGNRELARAMGERGNAKLERRYTVERIGDIVEATCARAIRRGHTVYGES